MAERSHPWPSVDSDRLVTSDMAAALNAALASDGVLRSFTGSMTSPNLTINAGSCMIRGVFHEITSPHVISFSGLTGSQKLIARYDATSRAIVLAVIPLAQALKNEVGVKEIELARFTIAAGAWSQPSWTFVRSSAAYRTISGVHTWKAVWTSTGYNEGRVQIPAGTFMSRPNIQLTWGGYYDGSAKSGEQNPLYLRPAPSDALTYFDWGCKVEQHMIEQHAAFTWSATGLWLP